MDNLRNKIKESDYFIIAEIGMNHDGSLGNAFNLIEEAKKAGVNAVKFQLHISEAETLRDAPKPPYFKLEERFDYFKRTSFTIEEWVKLKNYSHKLNLYFIVSPFSHKAVDILEEVNIDGYKIASGETTNLPLLDYINSKGKPILLSTGMSNWEEIHNAIKLIENNLIVLFQCSSQYPCTPENVGLNVVKEMHNKYPNLVLGFSDHTLNNVTSISAYIMGAKVFEKHFTLSKKMYGADARFSFEPNELKDYIKGLDFISKVLNNPVDKDDIKKYKEMKYIFEKSIVASRDIEKGETLKMEDLAFKKPCDGIRADQFKLLIGKKIKRNYVKNDKYNFKDLE